MARRKPGPAQGADGVPAWVRDVGYTAIIRDGCHGHGGVSDLHAEHLRRTTASRQWCVERGLSYCMTVLGWRLPAPAEVAAGLTKGPADL